MDTGQRRDDWVDDDVRVGLKEEAGAEPAQRIGPKGEERDVTEVEQAGKADDDVEAEREHHVRQREDLRVDEAAGL